MPRPAVEHVIPALVYNDESSGLRTQLAKLQLRESGSWSFQDCIPKLELGNESNERN
jgi:hypothetical protein